MLVAAAVCPHPPLLVPELAGAAAPELDDLRLACDEAVSRLVRLGPVTIVLIGSGAHTRIYDKVVRGSLQGFGVAFSDESGLNGDPDVPLSLTIGRWLLDRAGWSGGVVAHSLSVGLPPPACADLGWRLTSGPQRVALLVMGDGSARRGEKAPGHLDPEAESHDDAVARALAAGDVEMLTGLEEETTERLMATYRGPLQALAGAAAGGRWQGELLYHQAPYGVGYLTASWSRAGAAPPMQVVEEPEDAPDTAPEPSDEREEDAAPKVLVFHAEHGLLGEAEDIGEDIGEDIAEVITEAPLAGDEVVDDGGPITETFPPIPAGDEPTEEKDGTTWRLP